MHFNKDTKAFIIQSFLSSAKLILLSTIIAFTVDSLSRNSMEKTFEFIKINPLAFLFSLLIIMLSLSIVLLFKRRIFGYTIISSIWIIGGVANNIIMKFRNTPLTASDLRMTGNALKLLDSYLTKNEVLLLITSLIILIAILVLLFIFAPKVKYKLNIFVSICGISLIILICNISNKYLLQKGAIKNDFWNITEAYSDYSFTYCFTNSLLNTGIKKPSGYSESKINELVSNLNSDSAVTTLATASNYGTAEQNLPNIIMVQLESFFDITLLNNLILDTDPIPNFRYLMNNYSSGFMGVSCLGAGTANTEFEILTGMNVKHFGAGEYPYASLLTTQTSESIAYTLKSLGYGTHALHNNSATFYYRNQVFPNLGFDTFTSVEFMQVDDKTPTGWAKDSVLKSSIVDSLQSTESQDFVYAISVQGHGGYPEKKVLDNTNINVLSIDDDYNKNAVEYYINQIYEMDIFVKDLIEAVNSLNEDSIIVFYGDHLPSLGFTNESLSTNNLYETSYVIWDNMGLEKQDLNLTTYQMTAHILDLLDLEYGPFTKLHQDFINSEEQDSSEYQNKLKLLQYDIFFGNKYFYNTYQYYTPTNMKLGVKDIIINDYSFENGLLTVYGENFNGSSRLLIDGNLQDSVFVDANTITLSLNPNTTFNSIAIGQISSNANVISQSEPFFSK